MCSMKATTVNRKIEQLLLSLHTESVGSPNYKAAVEELKTLITNPLLYGHDTQFQLPETISEESIIVSDALESVTNGMYNPEALNRLQEITPESPFYPWKNAVLAILAFYQSDRDNMLQLLEKIPQETPPASLKPILQLLSRFDTEAQLDSSARELVKAVREDQAFLKSAIEQLEEYLDSHLEEAFSETAMLLVQDLLSSYPQAARRLALWSIRTAAEKDYDLSFFIGRFESMFGEIEGMRLIAIALYQVEPDVSLLFWLRYTIGHLSSGLVSHTELAALLSLVGDIIKEFKREGTFLQLVEDREYSQGLASLVNKLCDEVRRHFGLLESPFDRLFSEPTMDAYKWLDELADFDLNSSHHLEKDMEYEPSADAQTAEKNISQNDTAPRQLELF